MERQNRTKRRKRDKDYPKRKLSAYNLFFRDERKVILEEKGHPFISEHKEDYNNYDEDNDDEGHGSDDDMFKTRSDPSSDPVQDDDDDLHETKPTDTTEPVNTFRSSSTSGGSSKRGDSSFAASSMTTTSSSIPSVSATGAPHHKISFQDLAKTIGTRWKALDPERLKYYQDLAAKETDRFNAEMKVYQEKLKKKRMQQMLQKNQQEQDVTMFHQQNPSSYSSYYSSPSPSFPTTTTTTMMDHFSYPSQQAMTIMSSGGQSHKNGDDTTTRLQQSLRTSFGEGAVMSGRNTDGNNLFQSQDPQSVVLDENLSINVLLTNPSILSSILGIVPNSEEDRIALIFKLHQLNQLVEQQQRELQHQLATALHHQQQQQQQQRIQQQQQQRQMQQQQQSFSSENLSNLLITMLLSQQQGQPQQQPQQQQQQQQQPMQSGVSSSSYKQNLHQPFSHNQMGQYDATASISSLREQDGYMSFNPERQLQSQDANLLSMSSRREQSIQPSQPLQDQYRSNQQNPNGPGDLMELLQLQRELSNYSPSQQQQLLELLLQRNR